jgi:hypothetical protein
MKDILLTFLTFLICAALIVAVSFLGRSPGQEVYSYHSGFPPPVSPVSQGSGNNVFQKTGKTVERVYQRRFKWIDPSKKTRETQFHIPVGLLKKEIRKFGTSRAMSNPFFMKKKGFKIIGRRSFLHNNKIHDRFVSVVDYKQIFERNLNYFKSLTPPLQESAELRPKQDPLYSFLSFVQHIRYQLPPKRYRGRFINSFFIPLVVLYEQYGDCDSKSLLLADFLCTTPVALSHRKAGKPGEKVAMVLVRGNGLSHAVLAVKRPALPGMTSLYDIKKGNFILLETTRPGWSPGFINPRVTDTIKAGFFQFVELN